MKLIGTFFDKAMLIENTVYKDDRGFFAESYNERRWAERLLPKYRFVQDNLSKSLAAGTIRGLHFQLHPKAQTKLVQVVQGAVYDVIIDLRKGSATYKQWQSFLLSEHNHRQLLVPKGFAHGFCTLVPDTVVIYKVDEHYHPEYDSGIRWDDGELAIAWPVGDPILSEKDRSLPPLRESNHNFVFGENTG
ncbi:MAG: dTDP-4-dehydrorhamnose 3,5-epimerase [Ectobacillus sp.]